MVIQFVLQDLMIFLVCALGIAAGIILISILWKIKKVVDVLRPLAETNQEFMKKAIRTIPEIFENVEQISSNVRATTDELNISIPVILHEVECVTNTAKGSIQLAGVVMENMSSGINDTIAAHKEATPDFMAYFNILEEVLQIIYRTFSSKRI